MLFILTKDVAAYLSKSSVRHVFRVNSNLISARNATEALELYRVRFQSVMRGNYHDVFGNPTIIQYKPQDPLYLSDWCSSAHLASKYDGVFAFQSYMKTKDNSSYWEHIND